jgi:hypothetical protein
MLSTIATILATMVSNNENSDEIDTNDIEDDIEFFSESISLVVVVTGIIALGCRLTLIW